MGLFKLIRLGKAVKDLYDPEKQYELLERVRAENKHKFQAHVDSCPDLPKYPQVVCKVCEKVASETGNMGLLQALRMEARRKSKPPLLETAGKEAIIAAALEVWTKDSSLPRPEYAAIGDRYHERVYVLMQGDKTLGACVVEWGNEGKGLVARVHYVSD